LDNTLITDEELKTFEEWNKYDAAHEDEENDGNFCEPDGMPSLFLYLKICSISSQVFSFFFFQNMYLDDSSEGEYMDLVANPERYTGYKGPHAHKIWGSIYRENCFEK
jgi:hypothetical protein